MAGKNSNKVNEKKKKKRNLQNIEPEKLTEPLTVNVFNLKNKREDVELN